MTDPIKDDIIEDFYAQIDELYAQKELCEDQIDHLYNLIFQRTEFLKISAREQKATT